MTASADLAAWLGQVWDEEERLAKAATPGPWKWQDPGPPHKMALLGDNGRQMIVPSRTPDVYPSVYDGDFMEANHPGTVLARIAADRKILADYQADARNHREHWERQLARPASELHADRAHPNYEYATTEGPRKAWDGADVPPISRDTWEPEPGWERNVDEGRKGWDRFDYTEESYWRRPLPEGKRRGPFVPPVPRHIKLMAEAYADRPGYQEAWRPDCDNG